jgi:hypothetical protein
MITRDLVIIGDGPPASVVIRSPACIAIGDASVTVRGLALRQGEVKPGRFSRLLGRES